MHMCTWKIQTWSDLCVPGGGIGENTKCEVIDASRKVSLIDAVCVTPRVVCCVHLCLFIYLSTVFTSVYFFTIIKQILFMIGVLHRRRSHHGDGKMVRKASGIGEGKGKNKGKGEGVRGRRKGRVGGGARTSHVGWCWE